MCPRASDINVTVKVIDPVHISATTPVKVGGFFDV